MILIWLCAGKGMILMTFYAAIRSVSDMQITPASTPISHDMHLAVGPNAIHCALSWPR
jgi:hypothetical protein